MSAAASTGDQQTATARVADAVAPAVVRIGRHGGRGCGVVVADGLVATNAHNLRDRTTEVTFADGRVTQGRATAIDADGDLTVLAVDTGGIAAPAWADAAPAEGTPVYAVAAIPGGRRVTQGAVSAVDRSFRGPRGRLVTGAIEHTAPLGKGTSGSPVVDADGRIVGLTTLRLGDGLALAQPAGEACGAASTIWPPVRRRTASCSASAWRRPGAARRMRRAVGLAEREGALVRGVVDDSPAARAGLATGDLITRVGSRDVAGPADLEGALADPDLGTEVTIHVVRGAEELDLTVTFAEDGEDDGGDDTPEDAPTDA